MNNLKKLIKFIILGVITCTPIYFINKELDQSSREIGEICDRIGKKLDEARKKNNKEFAEMEANINKLDKLNKILNESEDKLDVNLAALVKTWEQSEDKLDDNLAELVKTWKQSKEKLNDNLNKSDEITDKTEAKIDEQKQE
ncbi:MAG: hypothetical protein Q8894_02525 [Sweet potato little leaf phytoplasma]|uniref:Uncharacterized protein n=1 Tax=Candidatus Phytoplasma fabacearum TaxID=2982628 RepID=A0ABU8ZTJ6_9MOLU|nr:hypothetical protein ['Bonamia sp.' little leaf phytoplasma]MDV3200439.1 hypothetical protein [Pigeon pea little leaf phytoplasma]MDV3204633.1 hypothetical protein [Sweet potato little leaf phytoplasma]